MATVKMKEGWLVLENVNEDGSETWEWSEHEPRYKDKDVWHSDKSAWVWTPNACKRIMYIDADNVELVEC